MTTAKLSDRRETMPANPVWGPSPLDAELAALTAEIQSLSTICWIRNVCARLAAAEARVAELEAENRDLARKVKRVEITAGAMAGNDTLKTVLLCAIGNGVADLDRILGDRAATPAKPQAPSPDILSPDGALAEIARLQDVLDRLHERCHAANDGPLKADLQAILADVVDCEACAG